MNFISGEAKRLFNASLHLLNQPLVKEGVKNVAGSVTFLFGMIEVYDMCQIARSRKISTKEYLDSPRWVRIANKMTVVCAKISLILSAGVSRPGVMIISSVVGHVFSVTQLERAFGVNTIFAINPWHPRHIVSLAAVILALPSVVQSTYKGINWIGRKICHHQAILKKNTHQELAESKIRSKVLFNTLTSRPALHIGNQLGRLILRRV